MAAIPQEQQGPSMGAILSSMGTIGNMGGGGGGAPGGTLELGLSSDIAAAINEHGEAITSKILSFGFASIFAAVQSPIFKGFEGMGLDTFLNLGNITASVTPAKPSVIKGQAK